MVGTPYWVSHYPETSQGFRICVFLTSIVLLFGFVTDGS